MIHKTVLPFKLEITHGTITSHAGLALLGEFCVELGLPAVIDRCMPNSDKGNGLQRIPVICA